VLPSRAEMTDESTYDDDDDDESEDGSTDIELDPSKKIAMLHEILSGKKLSVEEVLQRTKGESPQPLANGDHSRRHVHASGRGGSEHELRPAESSNSSQAQTLIGQPGERGERGGAPQPGWQQATPGSFPPTQDHQPPAGSPSYGQQFGYGQPSPYGSSPYIAPDTAKPIETETYKALTKQPETSSTIPVWLLAVIFAGAIGVGLGITILIAKITS